MKRPGRPLQPRSDTERLDLLVELLSFGRARKQLGVFWHHVAGLELGAGPPGEVYTIVARGDDLRQLLDRAISLKVASVHRMRAQNTRRSREKNKRKEKP